VLEASVVEVVEKDLSGRGGGMVVGCWLARTATGISGAFVRRLRKDRRV
jgi:hypothetical protein